MLCLKIQLRFCSERDGDFPSIPFDNDERVIDYSPQKLNLTEFP